MRASLYGLSRGGSDVSRLQRFDQRRRLASRLLQRCPSGRVDTESTPYCRKTVVNQAALPLRTTFLLHSAVACSAALASRAKRKVTSPIRATSPEACAVRLDEQTLQRPLPWVPYPTAKAGGISLQEPVHQCRSQTAYRWQLLDITNGQPAMAAVMHQASVKGFDHHARPHCRAP